MESNDWYYTLSTIAQSLAGLFGLLVAVVIYHLGPIKESIDKMGEETARVAVLATEVEIASKVFEEQITECESAHTPRPEDVRALRVLFDENEARLNNLESQMAALQTASQGVANNYRNIRFNLTRALYHTAWTIGICIGAMPWVNYVMRSPVYYVACAWLLGVVGLAFYCLRLYVPLVLSLVE